MGVLVKFSYGCQWKKLFWCQTARGRIRCGGLCVGEGQRRMKQKARDSPRIPDLSARAWAGSLGIPSSPSCASAGERRRGECDGETTSPTVPNIHLQWLITVCAHSFLDPAAHTRIQLIKQTQCNRITGKLFYSARPSKRIRTSDCKSIKKGYLAAQTLNQHHGKIWIRASALLNVKPLVHSIINLHLTKRSIKPCGKTGTAKK